MFRRRRTDEKQRVRGSAPHDESGTGARLSERENVRRIGDRHLRDATGPPRLAWSLSSARDARGTMCGNGTTSAR